MRCAEPAAWVNVSCSERSFHDHTDTGEVDHTDFNGQFAEPLAITDAKPASMK
jgi:hypothetical protein